MVLFITEDVGKLADNNLWPPPSVLSFKDFTEYFWDIIAGVLMSTSYYNYLYLYPIFYEFSFYWG